MDLSPDPNFLEEPFNQAKLSGIRVAYANQCFELWYWLHFDYQHTAVSRAEYGSRLSERLGRKYDKADMTLYEALKDLQRNAIRNAKNLLASYGAYNPEKDDPSTTVHLLVEFLNQFEP
jgi:7-cyano-7-deazaguanine synthase in queuosine biosynthesis